MLADADHGCHERVMLFRMDFQPVQAIIIEDPVIDAFRCGTQFINLYIGIRAMGDIRVKTDIPFRPGFYDLVIF